MTVCEICVRYMRNTNEYKIMFLHRLFISWFSILFPAPELQAPDVRPYRTPDTDKDAYTLSITFRHDFFKENNGPVANYSILVVEWPHPRSKSIFKIQGVPENWARTNVVASYKTCFK